MSIKYIFLDVSQTLLYKPQMEENYYQILQKYSPELDKEHFLKTHKSLSEISRFPDVTSADFYSKFNHNLLNLLAIEPNDDLLNEIFIRCKNLPWEPYEDVQILQTINLPIGIITNFNTSVRSLLKEKLAIDFQPIVVSEEVGVQKPHKALYDEAIQQVGLKPEEILYIGDSFTLDYEPANAIGIKSLLIDRIGFYPKTSFIIHNLAELTRFL